MKFEGAKAIVIGGMIIFICVVTGVYIYRMYQRQFPVESLDCQDGKVFKDQGNIDMFSVRVTNMGGSGVKDIRIRIGFFDGFGNPVDTVIITFPETIPARSSKLLVTRNIHMRDLPPQWKSTYTILDAKRVIERGK